MACKSSIALPALPYAATPAHARIRLILLSAVLLTAVHPGIFAGSLQVSNAHIYELKHPHPLELVTDDRSVGERAVTPRPRKIGKAVPRGWHKKANGRYKNRDTHEVFHAPTGYQLNEEGLWVTDSDE